MNGYFKLRCSLILYVNADPVFIMIQSLHLDVESARILEQLALTLQLKEILILAYCIYILRIL